MDGWHGMKKRERERERERGRERERESARYHAEHFTISNNFVFCRTDY